MMATPKEPKRPKLKLTGTDGNVFSVLGAARRALRKAGYTEEQLAAFTREATSGDYNKALATVCEWCEVS